MEKRIRGRSLGVVAKLTLALGLTVAMAGLTLSAGVAGASPNGNGGGFDQYGYNYTARVFNGTYLQWCAEQGIAPATCSTYLGAATVNDQLIMKWNAAWDACNASQTPPNCAGAWTDNELNGKVPGGDGYVWHYKIVYSQTCTTSGTPSNGGYCVWGDYEVLMDQGTVNGTHTSYALATPNGYGAYK